MEADSADRRGPAGAKVGRRRKTRITRQSLHNRVGSRLRDMIIHGELAPGEKVPVAMLSRTLDVSLTPLREALKVLAEEGLVELTPNRGARVLSYTPEEATALFEVIAGLESLAAELAAERMTADQLARLEAMHVAMRDHYENREKDPYFDLNNRIHEAIVAYTGNDILVATHAKLMIRARRGRYIAIVDPNRWREAMAEHEAVMSAFAARDSEQARMVWRLHLQHSGEVVSSVLKRQRDGELGADFRTLAASRTS